MNCHRALDLLLERQDGPLAAHRQARLQDHLDTCPACRSEEQALAESHVLLSAGARAMTDSIAPSARFYQALDRDLDAIDAARRSPRAVEGGASRHGAGSRGRWIGAAIALAALLSALVASGGAQQALAALRQWLYFVPGVGLGQVTSGALMLTHPVTAGNRTLTITVSDLVSGRRATLVSYTLRGDGLLSTSVTAPTADAVEANLRDATGHRLPPTYWLPVRRGLDRGVPVARGLLAFPALASGTRSARLEIERLPFTPPGPRRWSLTLPLQTIGRTGVRTSITVDRGVTRAGIRISVTDVTFTGRATVVDMNTAVEKGPFAGGTVVSLAPERATGAFAPLLEARDAGPVGATTAPLPAPLRLAVLPRPEFIFPLVPPVGGGLGVTVPEVEVEQPIAATVVIHPGARGAQAIPFTSPILAVQPLFISHTEVVTPAAALGLDAGQRLRLTLTFPPRRARSWLESVDVVVSGVSDVVGRDDPYVDVPLNPGPRRLTVTVENPLLVARGPWTIAVTRRSG